MAAVLYQLPVKSDGPVVAADPPQRDAASPAARWGLASAEAIVKRMLDTADDTLFGMGEKTTSEEERRDLFDSMLMLRKSAALIVEAFRAQLLPRSQRSASDQRPQVLALIDDEAIEQGITVARTVDRIVNAAGDALREYLVRIDKVPAGNNLREQFELLRPAGLAEAFSAALRAADVESPTNLILFKLYERQFIIDAGAYYEGLNEGLEAEGYSGELPLRRPAGAVLRPSEPMDAARGQGLGQGSGQGSGPGAAQGSGHAAAGSASLPRAAAQYTLPASLRALLSAASGPGGVAAGDGGYGAGPAFGRSQGPASALAGASAAAQAFVPGGDFGDSLNSEGGVQRMTLVSQLLDEIGRQWQPGELASLQRLLLPLVRIAIADGRFFGDAQHPARALITGLGSGVATDRDRQIGEIEHLLQTMQQGTADPGQLQPLAPTELLQFLSALRAPRSSTEARVAQARDAAHRQIKEIGSGRDLPEGMSSFLTEIWLPMVSAVYLRFGVDSPEWITTSELLERLFTQCRWLPTHQDPQLIDDILADLGSSLRAMAVPPKLIDKAQAQLRSGLGSVQGTRQLLDLDSFRARKRAEAPVPAAAAPAAPAARKKLPTCPGSSEDWRAAVPVSAWFRVYDRAADRTLWLTAEVLYPQAPGIAFIGFDPSVQLTVDREDFLDDLLAGKAEPVYPTEAQQAAIGRLCGELAETRKTR